MLGEDRGAVVVIALIVRLDVPVGLRRERADYVRERIISQPGHAVVVGLARPHSVARNRRDAHRAAGGLALVVPDGEESASVADGKIGLPLKAGSSIGIQLEWRAKGPPAVGGADVHDVAGVGASAVLGINEANYVVVGGRLTPSHVPPGVGAIHAHEVGIGGAISAAGGSEGGAVVGVGPSGAAVCGAIDFVGTGAGQASVRSFVHAGNVNIARNLVAGDLDVADEGGCDLYRAVPGKPVITGVSDVDALAGSEVVPGDVHSPEKWRGWVVIRVARLSVVTGTVVNASTNRPGEATVSGLPGAEAKTAAARSDKNSKESAGRFVVESNRVAIVRPVATGEGAGREAREGRATVRGE